MPRLVEGTARGWHVCEPELGGALGHGAPGRCWPAAPGTTRPARSAWCAIRPGDAFVSLGTSGVLWATTGRFAPYPQAAVHAFCHALPGTWHQMGVTLSAAASLAWWAGVTGRRRRRCWRNCRPCVRPARRCSCPTSPANGRRTTTAPSAVPSPGCRTTPDRAALTQAVLEGVAFSFRDCLDSLAASGTRIDAADVIGGGSRSPAWIAILAAVLGITLHRLAEGEQGGAFGAARLARLAVTGEAPEAVCTPPDREETIAPDPASGGGLCVAPRAVSRSPHEDR